LYRIEYEVKRDNRPFIMMNVGIAIFFLITVGVLAYIGRTVIRPFNKMSDMTVNLAKGNLSTPVKEEKSRFFGKFLWGVDMLRENLESSKTKNLEYQKEKKTMLLSLSHDIKTPLSAIQLYTKAMQEGLYETEEKRQEALSGILSKTEEIKSYVDEIHRVSREEFMEFDVNPGEVYMSEVMNNIGVYYNDKLSVIHTRFIMDEYEDCLLSADKDRLIEVIQNLMENAIKYGDGKEIRISFSEEEDCKLITVSNSGCSLDEKELANLFDSFYRGSNTDGIQGNGLGLYIVKQLMKRMDGDAFAEIEEDRFKITVVVRKA
jgi:signal transduction histidine kinase